MAEFLTAYKKTAASEGGYANVAGDTGGETYAGISRKWFPKWPGWKMVDANKPLKHNQKIKNTELEGMVRQFYKTEFWNKVSGDLIDDQLTAERLYDFGVNAGQGKSISQIETALGLKPTGKITPALIEAINHPGKYLIA